MARPTHHKWQTPHHRQQYPNCPEPTEMGKDKSRDRIGSSWSKSLIPGQSPGAADGQDTRSHCSERGKHSQVLLDAPSSPLKDPLKDPFTEQMRSKSKKFRRKLPRLCFFIYFCKINSRSLETQVCHIHDLQPTVGILEDNKQKANALVEKQAFQLHFCRHGTGKHL